MVVCSSYSGNNNILYGKYSAIAAAAAAVAGKCSSYSRKEEQEDAIIVVSMYYYKPLFVYVLQKCMWEYINVECVKALTQFYEKKTNNYNK